MTTNIALVKTDAAVSMLQGIERPSQMNAWLGDAEQFQQDQEVRGAVLRAHTALRDGGEKIKLLTLDETRSEPERHYVGGQVSERTVGTLDNTQKVLLRNAAVHHDAAMEALKERFAMRSDDKWLYDRWVGYVEREGSNSDGGYSNIRESMLANRDLAVVLHKVPYQLLGLPVEQVVKWQAKAVERWEPEVQKAFQYAEELRDLAGRYPMVIGMVKLNFHSPVHASKMKTRVSL